MRRFIALLLLGLLIGCPLTLQASVSVETTRQVYTGSGTTGPFPYTFKIFASSDIEVVKVAIATGTATTLTRDADYTLTGVGSATGGNVTLTAALSSDYQLVIRRAMSYLQPQAYTAQQPFTASSINAALDRLAMLSQQLADQSSRSLQLPLTASPGPYYVQPLADAAICWDSTGTALTSCPATVIVAPWQLDAENQLLADRDVVMQGGLLLGATKYVRTVAALTAALADATVSRVVVMAGTYTITPGALVLSRDGVTIELMDGVIADTTGADFAIKITGDDCAVIGPGKIRTTGTPTIAGAGSVPLRKATVWNTGDRTRIDGVVFDGSVSYTIFNEGGSGLQISHCRFLGAYSTYTLAAGTNHFAYYQDGGSDNALTGNYVEHYAQGFGSGVIAQPAGARMTITGNTWDHIGNHPVYIASGGDGSIVNNNTHTNCGGSFALTGSGIQANNNNCHLDSSVYGAQAGLAFRNPSGCEAIGNIITGVASQIVMAVENTGAGTSIADLTLADNQILMTSGTASGGIRVGTGGTTTSITGVKIRGNVVKGISLDAATSALIKIVPTAADQVTGSEISGNTATLQSAGIGIDLQYASGCGIDRNTIRNTTTYGSATVIHGIRLPYSHDCEVSRNTIETTTSTNLTLYDFREVGTSAQVYNNRYSGNKTTSAITGGLNTGPVLIAGNGSQVSDYENNDKVNVDTGGTIYLKDGPVLFLTATAAPRNLVPYATYPWPKNYRLDIYNVDPANAITFEPAGVNQAVAAGKHGIFHYTGSAWKGGQID